MFFGKGMAMRKLFVMLLCLGMGTSALAVTVIWPQQPARSWDDPNAVWETAPGTSYFPPEIGDYAYILSTNEITVDSAVNIKRLFIDRAVTGYPTVASTITVVSGGELTVNSICQPGHGIDGGTINISGGNMIMSNAAGDRTGTYSLLIDDNYASILNITDGTLSIRNGSEFEFSSGSQAVVTVSGTGLIEFMNGSKFDMGSGAQGVTISDTGLIKYVGRDATSEVQTLARAGQLTGVLIESPPLYTPTGTGNGVGWYYDGSDTYVFTATGPDIEIGDDRLVWLADAMGGIPMDGQILNFDPGETYTYVWSGAGVSFSPNNAVEDPSAVFSSGGTYTVTLQVTNSLGVGADSITVYVLDPAVENKQIAHWAMDDGAGNSVSDSSIDGFENTGTILGTADWQNGWVGSHSLHFNGLTTVEVTPDKVSDPNLNLNEIQYGITLAAWIKADVAGLTQYVLEKPGSYYLRLLPTTGGFRAQFSGLSDQNLDYTAHRFDDGNWYHVAATYDAVDQEANLYVNGLLLASQPASGLIATSDPNLVIGAALNGGLDDMYVYSYALNETEVQALAAMGDKVPLVYAGSDQLYQINPSLPLIMQGQVQDLDSSPGIEWIVSPDSVGSPASVTFVDASDPMTGVYFNPADPDIFTLRLTATDTVGGGQVVVYDEVVVTTNAPTCTDVIAAGLALPLDLSGPIEGQPDCYVDLLDLAYLAASWLECNDPENAQCDWPWQ